MSGGLEKAAARRRRGGPAPGTDTPVADLPADGAERQSIFTWLRRPEQLAEFETALPAGIDPTTFRRTLITAIKTDDRLRNATHGSVLAAALQAAQLGLYPGPLQHVIFRTKPNAEGIIQCEFLLGVAGIIELALRSPHILDVEAHTVYEDDVFLYRQGTEPYLVHEPNLDATGFEPVRAAWTLIRYANGHTRFRVFTRAHIDALRRAHERDLQFWSEWELDADGNPVEGEPGSVMLTGSRSGEPPLLRNPRFEGTLHASLLRAERRYMRLSPEAGAGLANDGQILDVNLVRSQMDQNLDDLDRPAEDPVPPPTDEGQAAADGPPEDDIPAAEP